MNSITVLESFLRKKMNKLARTNPNSWQEITDCEIEHGLLTALAMYLERHENTEIPESDKH